MKVTMKLNPTSGGNAWYTMAARKDKKHLDIYLYGVIGGYRVNAQRFVDELQAAGDVKTINVYLNTVGGSFYDGLSIYNTLKQHSARVTTRVMGYALSMGSVIMLAGDRIEAAENSLIMIHRAQGEVRGDADDFLKACEILEKHEACIIPEYSRRLGVSADAVSVLLKDETWYTASEAKTAGLVDVVMGKVVIDSKAAGISADSLSFVNQHFHKVPEALSLEDTEGHGPEEPEALEYVVSDADQVRAIAVEVVRLMQSERQNESPDSSETVKKLEAALDESQRALAEAEQRVVDLSKPDPSKNTPPHENTGPAEDYHDWGSGLKDFI